MLFLQDDLGVGAHVGLQLAAGVVEGYPHLESGDVVLLHPHGGNLGHCALEFLVREGFHRDACRLLEIDLADVGFVHLAADEDLAHVAQGHDQSGLGTQHQDGADRVAHFDVAGEHQAVHGTDDGGVAQVFLGPLQRRLCLCHLRPGARHLRTGDGHIAQRGHLLVER